MQCIAFLVIYMRRIHKLQDNLSAKLLTLLNQHSVDYQCVCLDRARNNLTMTSSDIQNDILRAMASCVREHIVKQIGDSFFRLLIDKARDESKKEQMYLVLRFVDSSGPHDLSLFRVRVQGYDRAYNMRGDIKGLKTMIQREKPSEYYVHYFAHRLQLALISTTKNHIKTKWKTHFVSVCRVLDLYDLVVKVLEIIVEDATVTHSKAETSRLFLVLILPVSDVSTRRSLSTLKIVKMRLRNKMEDEYLAHAISLFVERKLAQGITTDVFIEKFQALSTRHLQLD
ncbi:hypothetical protein MPTK1_6g08630 [Marchantia polymorpha subsp. ruderalis]|uniref:DUF4371 domain-containing protein n=2 Tax=Marchantia polymorpha TaxID=3197 RepID=A0AAF6BPY9_MARPO|nr:hypothetical protein MARPO_0060s0058 [Marchantia polymorpha]BBN14073.1 hypothetical protein Mp_6g08630 [Marchantia polymorpha subsp. ruderalis]|eukprot:PTQ36972.1 hypothetical protein MARPO_0060s0058 [Marchantia polymorpha]